MIQSPYRRGADDGLVMGVYFMVMFFTSIFSGALPLLSLLSVGMMVAVPGVVYVMMRRYHRSLGVASSFAMLWMYGVVLFFCGMLLAGAVLVAYLRWVSPEYISDQLAQLASLEGEMPGSVMDDAAGLAQQMIDAGFVPTAISIVSEMIMLAIVTGSMLSLVLSGIMTVRFRRSVNQMKP